MGAARAPISPVAVGAFNTCPDRRCWVECPYDQTLLLLQPIVDFLGDLVAARALPLGDEVVEGIQGLVALDDGIEGLTAHTVQGGLRRLHAGGRQAGVLVEDVVVFVVPGGVGVGLAIGGAGAGRVVQQERLHGVLLVGRDALPGLDESIGVRVGVGIHVGAAAIPVWA